MKRYWPLIVVVFMSIIAGAALLAISPADTFKYLMVNFSGMFFLFLATLKFWDLKGFCHSFREYDLVATRFPLYGYIYPFLELLIAIGYLSHFFLPLVGIVTAILMIILAIGVFGALFKGKDLKCACMGTKLDLPLGVVSVVESLAMGVMAVLIVIHSL